MPPEHPSALDAIYERAFKECRPLTVLWELTYECNLRCRHCYVEPEPERDAPLSTAEAGRVLDELASAGVLFLAFSGGEPFLRGDLAELLERACGRSFAVRLLTNGTMIDEDAAGRLAGLGNVSVDVSVYGDGPTHDSVTGHPGSFEKMRRGLELLLKHSVRTRLKTVVMKSNLAAFAEVRSLADGLGLPLIFDTSVAPRPSGDRSPLAEQLRHEELFGFFARLYAGTRPEPGTNLDPGRPPCSAARSAARITPSGHLTPCVALPMDAGSLRDKGFDELWRSPVFENLRPVRLADLPVCRDCEVRAFCVRCPGLAFLDGDLTGPSEHACRLARALRALSEGARPGERALIRCLQGDRPGLAGRPGG